MLSTAAPQLVHFIEEVVPVLAVLAVLPDMSLPPHAANRSAKQLPTTIESPRVP
jgi:hypothetical protein